MKQEAVTIEGTVGEALPSYVFRVQLDNDCVTLCTVAGKLRRHRIRVVSGDRVTVEVSPHDLSRGRITARQPH